MNPQPASKEIATSGAMCWRGMIVALQFPSQALRSSRAVRYDRRNRRHWSMIDLWG
jgi:hypothetical protein